MKNQILCTYLVFILICHVWTAPVHEKRQIHKRNDAALNAPSINMRSAGGISAIDDKRKKVMAKRDWFSFLPTNELGCFRALCQPAVSACKKNKVCKAALKNDYPKNGIRAKNYQFKSAKGFTAIVACKQQHLKSIQDGCPGIIIPPTTIVITTNPPVQPTPVPAPAPAKVTPIPVYGCHSGASDFCYNNGGNLQVRGTGIPAQSFLCWNVQNYYKYNNYGYIRFPALYNACWDFGSGDFQACWTVNHTLPTRNGNICGYGKNRLAMVRTKAHLAAYEKFTAFCNSKDIKQPLYAASNGICYNNGANQVQSIIPNQKYLCINNQNYFNYNPFGYVEFTNNYNICWQWGSGDFLACWTAAKTIPTVDGYQCGYGKNRLAMVRPGGISVYAANKMMSVCVY